MRRLLPLVMLMVVVGLALPALGAPPTTETTTHQGLTETFVETVSCEGGATHEITITYNLIEHVTEFGDGRVHFTFTQTGTFEAVALEPGGLDASGHFAVWGGFNDNGKSVNGTFTFNANGVFEDGSRLSVHAVDHFNVTPTGAEFFFIRCRE
jgi:hypothetical protein